MGPMSNLKFNLRPAEKTPLSLKIREPLLAKVKAVANPQKISLTSIVERGFELWLEEEAKKKK